MALYLVLISTLGSIRGVFAKEFVEGETVDLDDEDLAAVGCRDGWLTPVDDLASAPPVEPKSDYTVLLPDEMPVPRSGWEADRPKEGEIVSLTDEEAAPLLESGAIQLATDGGVTETDQFPEDYTQYVALQEIPIDESGDLLLPGDQFGMSAEQAADWLEAGLIALAPVGDAPPAPTPPTPPTPPQAGGNENAPAAAPAPREPKKKAAKAVATQGGSADGIA